jgi:hypothetical protein
MVRKVAEAHATGYRLGDPAPKVPSVKVCPSCAEELPDEATVCSKCHKDPAVAPARSALGRPDEPSPWRLGDVFGPDGVLPTSDNVPAPFKRLEPARRSKIPSKVWASLILAFSWGIIVGTMVTPLPWGSGLILRAGGYVVGLILGIWGRAEAGASDGNGEIVGRIAIALNAFPLAWIVFEAIQYGLVVRG